MNFLSEQLYQKNTLLKTYEKQNQRLKSIISKEKSIQYLKFPKDGSLTNKINDLEIENHNIKKKLNQTLLVNTQLMNKAEREKMFYKKLEAQNQTLKNKLILTNQKLQVQNEQILIGNIENGIVDFSMLTNLLDAKCCDENLTKQRKINHQKGISTSYEQRANESLIDSITNINPKDLLSRVFSTTKSSSVQQKQIVIRTLNMQRQNQQYLEEIRYLKRQLQETKQELQRSQAKVKTLQQKVLQLQQNNHSNFVLVENDKLQGSLAQMQLIRSTLQSGLVKARQENMTRQKEIQELRESMGEQIQSLSAENDILRKTFQKRQSLRLYNTQHQLKDSWKSNNLGQTRGGENKRRKYSQISIKTHKSIKSHKSIKQLQNSQLESKIEILVDSERDVARRETKDKETSDTKELVCGGSIQKQNGMNSIQRQGRQTLDMLSQQNLLKYSKSFQQYLVNKPVIKQTRVSFMLDDISQEDHGEEERQRQKQSYEKDKMGEMQNNIMGRNYQNSLMSNRNKMNVTGGSARSELNEGEGMSLWDQIKNVFGG